jgi:hypothetical protein
MRPAVTRLTLAAAASLLLCVATVALWMRSYWAADFVGRYDGGGGAFSVISCMGSIQLGWQSSGYGNVAGLYWRRDKAHRWGDLRSTFRFQTQSVGTYRGVIFPHWPVALLSAILPALRLRTAIRSRCRERVGLCPNCGYDLRATPHGCPECGAVPAAR